MVLKSITRFNLLDLPHFVRQQKMPFDKNLLFEIVKQIYVARTFYNFALVNTECRDVCRLINKIRFCKYTNTNPKSTYNVYTSVLPNKVRNGWEVLIDFNLRAGRVELFNDDISIKRFSKYTNHEYSVIDYSVGFMVDLTYWNDVYDILITTTSTNKFAMDEAYNARETMTRFTIGYDPITKNVSLKRIVHDFKGDRRKSLKCDFIDKNIRFFETGCINHQYNIIERYRHITGDGCGCRCFVMPFSG